MPAAAAPRLRQLWPEVVDHLGSGIRAGLSLPEAVAQIGERGPVELREAFTAFAEDYRATGRFGDCLDALKARLADPVADRIVEALRITRDVGGTDLGRLLRTLSTFLREDVRTRGELEARQSWTVNAARLAVAAPWIVLALLATRPEAAAAYDTPGRARRARGRRRVHGRRLPAHAARSRGSPTTRGCCGEPRRASGALVGLLGGLGLRSSCCGCAPGGSASTTGSPRTCGRSAPRRGSCAHPASAGRSRRSSGWSPR